MLSQSYHDVVMMTLMAVNFMVIQNFDLIAIFFLLLDGYILL